MLQQETLNSSKIKKNFFFCHHHLILVLPVTLILKKHMFLFGFHVTVVSVRRVVPSSLVSTETTGRDSWGSSSTVYVSCIT